MIYHSWTLPWKRKLMENDPYLKICDRNTLYQCSPIKIKVVSYQLRHVPHHGSLVQNTLVQIIFYKYAMHKSAPRRQQICPEEREKIGYNGLDLGHQIWRSRDLQHWAAPLLSCVTSIERRSSGPDPSNPTIHDTPRAPTLKKTYLTLKKYKIYLCFIISLSIKWF